MVCNLFLPEFKKKKMEGKGQKMQGEKKKGKKERKRKELWQQPKRNPQINWKNQQQI